MNNEQTGKGLQKVYDTKETARMLGLSPGTLANWRTTGKHGPDWVRACGRIMYRLSDINEWLEKNIKKGGTA